MAAVKPSQRADYRPPPHGTRSRYNHRDPAVRCRCDKCRAGNARYIRNDRDRARGRSFKHATVVRDKRGVVIGMQPRLFA